MYVSQDDELPLDRSCKWLDDVVRIFEDWPSIGGVGHRGYVFEYISGEESRRVNHVNNGMFFRDPASKVGWQNPATLTRDEEMNCCLFTASEEHIDDIFPPCTVLRAMPYTCMCNMRVAAN